MMRLLIVLGLNTDFIPIANHYRVSEFASSVASHMHELYKKISDKVDQNNANYKLQADVGNRLKFFNVGNVVKKLHA